MKYKIINYKDTFIQNINIYKTRRDNQYEYYQTGGMQMAYNALDWTKQFVNNVVGRPKSAEQDPRVLRKKELQRKPILRIKLPKADQEEDSDYKPDTYFSVADKIGYNYKLNIPELFSEALEENVDKLENPLNIPPYSIDKKLYRRILCAQILMLKLDKVIKILEEILKLFENANKYKTDNFVIPDDRLVFLNLDILNQIKQHLISLHNLTLGVEIPLDISESNNIDKIYQQLVGLVQIYSDSDEYYTNENKELLVGGQGAIYPYYRDEDRAKVMSDLRKMHNDQVLENIIEYIRKQLQEKYINKVIPVFPLPSPPTPPLGKQLTYGATIPEPIKSKWDLVLSYRFLLTMEALYKLVPNDYKDLPPADFSKLDEVCQQIIFYLQSNLNYMKSKLLLLATSMGNLFDTLVKTKSIIVALTLPTN